MLQPSLRKPSRLCGSKKRYHKGPVRLTFFSTNCFMANKGRPSGTMVIPEGRRVFPRTSVMDNLLLGAYSRKDKENVKGDLNKIFEMFPRLLERKNQLAGTLSGGEQQMLAMGRALMSRPRLLLLDEPSMGLSPRLVDQVFDTIVSINKSGTTIMLVEQNANQALRVAKRGYVIETGEIVLSDDADKLLSNPQVKEAYLGG